MKIRILLSALLLLAGCAKDSDGIRHYVGPRISGSVSLKGVTVGVTLYEPVGPPSENKPVDSIEIPHTVPTDGKAPAE